MKCLGVACKTCGQLFRTSIMMGVYGRPVLGNATWSCPACNMHATYANEDYRLILA